MGRLPGPRSDRAAPASQRLQDRPRLPSPPPTSSQARYPQCPGSAHTRAQSGPTPPPPTWAEPAPRPLISLKQRLLVEAALPGPFQPRACALPPSRAQTPRGQAAPSQSLKQTRSPGALYTEGREVRAVCGQPGLPSSCCSRGSAQRPPGRRASLAAPRAPSLGFSQRERSRVTPVSIFSC